MYNFMETTLAVVSAQYYLKIKQKNETNDTRKNTFTTNLTYRR